MAPTHQVSLIELDTAVPEPIAEVPGCLAVGVAGQFVELDVRRHRRHERRPAQLGRHVQKRVAPRRKGLAPHVPKATSSKPR